MKMYSCLPWELRNHIHTFCVQGSHDNEVIIRSSAGRESILFVRQSTGAQSYQWIEDPILSQFSPSRIGEDAAMELLDAYYKTRTFKFSHRELGLLQVFLQTDEFCLGIRPAGHIRRLHLQIQPFLYAQLQDTKSKDLEYARCCLAIQGLSAIKSSRTTVMVHIDLTQGISEDEEYKELLTDAAGFVFGIIRIIDSLKGNNLNFEVIFEGGWDERNKSQLCSKSVASLDDCISQMEIVCT